MRIEVVQGDITRQDVEAVVTAANRDLVGGGGVDAGVHRAAGPQLVRASRALAPCPAGGAVVTPAFDLAPVRWVVHAVGPVYRGPQDAEVLASAYVQWLCAGRRRRCSAACWSGSARARSSCGARRWQPADAPLELCRSAAGSSGGCRRLDHDHVHLSRQPKKTCASA